jgi:hypothetical protein
VPDLDACPRTVEDPDGVHLQFDVGRRVTACGIVVRDQLGRSR